MNDDWENLRRFRQTGDQDAFAQLVRRYIDLVWAVGFRITGDADLARDVAQTVFSDLARKAGSMPQTVVLAGWLHRAASYAAFRAVRDETRRKSRERQAMAIQPLHPTAEEQQQTDLLLPLLDKAVAKLRQKDRDTILLRYYGKQSLAEIGAALGISEAAAQKRLTRALDRLRGYFRRRGLETSGAIITAALGAAGAQAAPAGLAVAVTSASVSTAVAAGTSCLAPWLAQLPGSVFAMKTSILTTSFLVATVGAPLLYQQQIHSRLANENKQLRTQLSSLPKWREIHGQNRAQLALARELDQLRQGRRELVQLRAEAAVLQSRELEQKLVWQNRLESAQSALAKANASTAEIESKLLSRNVEEDMARLGLCVRIWAKDMDGQLPRTFQVMTNELALNTEELERFVEPYQFVQHPRPISQKDSDLLLIREKEPRALPDGQWARTYTLVDGSVHERISDTPDFSQWEHRHLAKP